MKGTKKRFLIAQLSDLHCGDARFDRALLNRCIEIINRESPDAVIVAGDLTANGYRDEFEEAAAYMAHIECPCKVVIAGNHDCRNVGYVHFEELFGPRASTLSFIHCGDIGKHLSEQVKVVAVDSNKADLNDGEVGRHNYDFIQREFAEEGVFKIFVLHHHLVHVPGTGRERNIVWDAGDVMQVLRDMRVDLVLSGHKHVPYVWPVAHMYLVTSGTASTWRTRGRIIPSFNLVEIREKELRVEVISAIDGERQVLPYPRWWLHESFALYPR
jgi:3',5'-cyclic AMP phosphodiesterase CpdA